MTMVYKVDRLLKVKALGGTAVVVVRPHRDGASIGLKLEGTGLGGSVKDRAVWGMLRRAEERGELRDGAVLVEPTSGNTGVSLAMLGRALGLKVILTMPESMSLERRSLLKAYGAHVVLTSAEGGMAESVVRARRIVEETPGALLLDQFSNPGNPWAHGVTTAPEIVREFWGRRIDAFVAGVGTGGTLVGTGRGLRQVYPDVAVVAVEPQSSPVLSGGRAGAHGIQGIGAGFVPDIMKGTDVTEVISVSDREALEGTKELVDRWGLFCGLSSGANFRAALRKAREIGPDGLVVTVLPDRGERYLSVGAFG